MPAKKIYPWFAALAILLPSILNAQIAVNVQEAQVIKTVTPHVVSQMSLEDGTPIGAPVESVMAPETIGPQEIKVLMFDVPRREDGDGVLVSVSSETCVPVQLEPGSWYVDKPGTHELEIFIIAQNPLFFARQKVEVSVGSGGSDVTIVPPIAGEGFRVLVVYESEDLSTLPESQRSILYSPVIRGFLTTHCHKDGGSPCWRFLENDTEFPET